MNQNGNYISMNNNNDDNTSTNNNNNSIRNNTNSSNMVNNDTLNSLNISNNNMLSSPNMSNNNILNSSNTSSLTGYCKPLIRVTTNSLCDMNSSSLTGYCNSISNNSEIKKKELIIIAEMKIIILEYSKIEIEKKLKKEVDKKINNLRESIQKQEVIRQISFLFENEIEMMINRCVLGILRDVYCALQLNQEVMQCIVEETKANMIIRDPTFVDIIEGAVKTLKKEINEDNWYTRMIIMSIEIKSEVKRIRKNWGEMVKKIEKKINKKNETNSRRDINRKKTEERSKRILTEVKYEVSSKCRESQKEIDKVLDKKEEEIKKIVKKISERINKGGIKRVEKDTIEEIVKKSCEAIIEKSRRYNWFYIPAKGQRIETTTTKRIRYLRLKKRNKIRRLYTKQMRKEALMKRKKNKKKKKNERNEEDDQKERETKISDGRLGGTKDIKDNSKEMILLYLAKIYYVD